MNKKAKARNISFCENQYDVMTPLFVLLFPFAVSSAAVPGKYPVLKYESKLIMNSAWVSLGTFTGVGSFHMCSAR